MDSFTGDDSAINGSASVGRNQPCLFLRHVVGLGLNIGVFKEVGKVPRKLIGAAMRAMGFC